MPFLLRQAQGAMAACQPVPYDRLKPLVELMYGSRNRAARLGITRVPRRRKIIG